MAVRKAVANGNWSAGATWDSPPVDGDTVYANGFTVTIDQVLNQASTMLLNSASTGISAGGAFVLGGNFDVTVAGVTNGSATSTFQVIAARTATLSLGTCQGGTGVAVVISTTGGSVITFANTTFIGGTGNSVYGLYVTISATIAFSNCTARGGSGVAASGVVGVSSGTWTGTLHLSQSSSSQQTASAFQINTGSLVATLSGDVVHQGAGWTVQIDSGTFTYTVLSETITGSCAGNGNQGLWTARGSASLTLTRSSGTITHSTSTHYLWKGAAAATIVCNGNVSCGTSSGQYVAYDSVTGAGSITINGTVTGPSSNYGAASGLWANSGGKIYVQNLAVGAGGTMPSLTNVCLMSSSQIVAPTSGGNLTFVNSASAGDYPSAANVRSGTSYAYGALTGTCAVPAAGSVANGVSVDATTGTAVLTSAAAQSACSSALTNYETHGVASQDDLAGVTVDLSGVLGYLTAILAIFTGMTSLPNWLRRLFRSDAGTAAMATALSEINAGSPAGTFAAGDGLQDAGGLTTDQNTKLTEIHEAIYPEDPDDSPLVITPSDPDHVTGWSVCYGLDGQAAAGIVVTYKLQSPPPRDAGKILNGATTGTETSASNGLVQFEGLLPGATYYFTCGATTVTCTIPLDADPEAGYQLPSFVKT